MTDSGRYDNLNGGNANKAAAGQDGRVHVIWYAGSSLYYKRYNPGFGWSNDTVLFSINTSAYPAITLDSNGTSVHVVWMDYSYGDGNYHVYHVQCDPTGNGNDGWGLSAEDVAAVGSNTYNLYPSVACSPGRVHVAWTLQYYDGTDWQYGVGYRERIGGTWQDQIVLDKTASYGGRNYPSIAANQNHDVVISWYGDGPDGSGNYGDKRVSGTWTEGVSITSPDYTGYAAYSVSTLDAGGRWHVAWFGYGPPDWFYKVYYRSQDITVSTWSGIDTVSPDGGRNSNIAVSPNGRVHVVFTDDSRTRYRMRDAGGTWQPIEDVSLSGDGNYRDNPSITADSDNFVHVVWNDTRNGSYDIYYRQTIKPPARDLACKKVVTPVGVYTKGSVVYPEVKLANLGSDAQSGFPVTVWIDAGGTRVYNETETFSGTLAPFDTAHFALTTPFTVNYPLCHVTAFTSLGGDERRRNDTAFASCAAADFIQDFETSDGNLRARPDTGGWAWGTPTGGGRPAAHSGTYVWGDVLSGHYGDFVRDSLRMGPFKATVDNPIVGWWSSYQTDAGYDGYSLYFSTDNGSSWTMTHAAPGFGRGYDMLLYPDYDSAYSGDHSGWEQMLHKIPVPSGTSFTLMWMFRSYYDWYSFGGVLIDDVAGFGFAPPARDIGVAKILTPSGLYTKGTTVYPDVKLCNFGTDAQSGFPVTVWIDAGGTRVYNATETFPGTLAPGGAADFTLTTPFTINYPFCRVTAFTNLSGDLFQADDTAFGSCLAPDFTQDFETSDGGLQASPDTGAWAWGTPSGGSRLAPHSGTHVWGDVLSGYYHNNARDSLLMGPFKANVDNPLVGWWSWYFTLTGGDGYALYFSTDNGSSWTMTHAVPGVSRGYDMTIYADYDSAYSGYHYASWEQMLHMVPVPSGTSFMLMWMFRKWVYPADMDGVMIDDVAGYGFKPPALDAGVVKILAPSGMIPLDPIAPKAVIRNGGTQTKPFTVTFSINCTPPYQKTVNVTVPPLSVATVQFPNWTPKDGYFTARCQTFLTGDENPGNDWKTLDFSAVPFGWSARAPMPTLPSGKAEGAGGWLAYNTGDGLIYAAKGENTSDFYSYNLRTNTWTNLPPIPKGTENVLPGDGCRGVADGQDNIYMTKGANTLGFWRYTISTQTWTQLSDVPAGSVNVQAGTDLAFDKLYGYYNLVYLLKGQNGEFYRYYADYSIWQQVSNAPVGSDSIWADGSWLVSDGGYLLYAHKALTREMYPNYYGYYWYPGLTGMPLISRYEHSKLPLGIGGCAAWKNSAIYALKGSNTSQFWKYLPTGDSWTELDLMPLGSTPKRVHAGGDITATADFLFAFKGSKTNELWRYRPRPESSFLAREGVQASPSVIPLELALSIAPNPVRLGTSIHYAVPAATNVSLKLYNVTGALAKTVSNGRVKPGHYTVSLSAKGLARGVYILKLQSDAGNLTRKVVIE